MPRAFHEPFMKPMPTWKDFSIDYPFFPLDRSERKSGMAKLGRFRHRLESVALLDHPKLKGLCQIADDHYHNGGRWADYNLYLQEGYDGPEVWAVMRALESSDSVNHIQRYVAVGLALFNWFAYPTPEELEEIRAIKNETFNLG